MASELYVFVYLPGESRATPAGLFSHDAEHGVGTFTYGRRYRDHGHALAVDPISCPLRGPITPATRNGGLYGAFRDAAPDYWGRLVIARRLRTDPAALAEPDLLLHGGPSRVGNLDFRVALDDPEPDAALPALVDLRELVAASDAVQGGSAVDEHWLELLRQGTSVGGARPKCVVTDDGRIWVAKLPAREDTFSNARVEHATLCLARAAGIETAYSRVEALPDGRDVLLVRRFDRERVEGGFSRTGFISALTVLRLDDVDRVHWSYVALAERLRQQRIPAGTHAQLYRRMVFNVACRNVDDHPRNHGFLVGADRLALSPAYDIVPQPARPGVATDFSLAMTIGTRGREATVENVLSRSESFGLSRQRAAEVCREVGAVAMEWREFFDQAGVARDERALFDASFSRAAELARV